MVINLTLKLLAILFRIGIFGSSDHNEEEGEYFIETEDALSQ